jgi:hypothetical protein
VRGPIVRAREAGDLMRPDAHVADFDTARERRSFNRRGDPTVNERRLALAPRQRALFRTALRPHVSARRIINSRRLIRLIATAGFHFAAATPVV